MARLQTKQPLPPPPPSATTENIKPISLPEAFKEIREGYAKGFIESAGNFAQGSYQWNSLSNFSQALSEIEQTVANSSPEEAKRQARRLANSAPTPEMKALFTKLEDALSVAQKEKEADAIKRINAQFEQFLAAIESAQKAEDLNPVIEQFNRLYYDIEGFNYNSIPGQMRNVLSSMRDYISRWQMYFLNSADPDNGEQARRDISSLSNDIPHNLPVTVRVRLLKHINALSKVAQKNAPKQGPLMTKAHELLASATLETIEQVKDDMLALESSAEHRSASSRDKNALNRLNTPLDRLVIATCFLDENRASAAHELLRPSSLSNTVILEIARNADLARLWDAWYFKAIPQLTGLSDHLSPPKKGERAQVYVARLYDEAVDAGRWPDAAILARLERDLRMGGYSCEPRAASTGKKPDVAIESFLAGQLLEKAAQPKAATECYQNALKQGAPSKLERLLIERLSTLGE